ncbi:MAG: hypothetical protein M3R14_13380 [Acidobacteriota bacterium]|nr:hypothetical protein [Acidobacteriota bacterium]
MSKKDGAKNLMTNGDGKKSSEPKYERLPKDFEADTSPTALALIKAVRMTRRRLYPELYEAKKKRA